MLGAKFLVTLEIYIALVAGSEREDEAHLRPDSEHARLEIANSAAAVACELLVGITNQPNHHLLAKELRGAHIEMEVDAIAIVGVWILEIVGEATHRG